MTIMTSLVLLSGLTILPSVSAHDTGDTYPFDSNDGTHNVCIKAADLNGIELNGNTNEGSDIATLIENGMDELSDNTDMSLTRITTCTGTYSHVYGAYNSDEDKLGQTSVDWGSYPNQYKTIKINTNSASNMIDSGNCYWYQNPHLEYVANHEFGHFAGMDYYHHSSVSGHTMNEGSCEIDWAGIKSGDITQINGWY